MESWNRRLQSLAPVIIQQVFHSSRLSLLNFCSLESMVCDGIPDIIVDCSVFGRILH